MQRVFVRLWTYAMCLMVIFLFECSSGDEPRPVDCEISDLQIQLVDKTDPTNCSANDGSITVSATGGASPYKFNINNGSFGSSATFSNLGGGAFTITVKDKEGCSRFIDVSLVIPGENALTANTNITADTECVGNNGEIEVEASGGSGPYQFKLNNNAFTVNSLFTSLAPGSYVITVKDNVNCQFSLNITVPKGDSNTSLATDVKPIIDAKCAINGCHNGTQSPDLRSSSAIISNAGAIKAETQSGRMPKNGSLTSSEKALIACWVDEGAKNN